MHHAGKKMGLRDTHHMPTPATATIDQREGNRGKAVVSTPEREGHASVPPKALVHCLAHCSLLTAHCSLDCSKRLFVLEEGAGQRTYF
jgi:hypothetical protein